MSGFLMYFSPMDFAIVATCVACGWRLWKDQKGVFKLWSLPFAFIAFVVTGSYLRSIPMAHPLWSVQDWWTLRSGVFAELMGILLGSSFKVIILFLIFLFFCMGSMLAWRRHWAKTTLLGLLPACFLLGFRPYGMQQEQTADTLWRIENLSPAFVQWAAENRQPKTLDVVARKPDNQNWIKVRPGQILLIVHQPELEQGFFIRNMRQYDEAKADPRYIRAKFNEPCTFRAGMLHQTPDGAWPIDPRSRPLPASTSIVSIKGKEWEPVTDDATAFITKASGEITMSYNMPRGADDYMIGNMDGQRTFKIWVVDYEDFQAFKSTAQNVP